MSGRSGGRFAIGSGEPASRTKREPGGIGECCTVTCVMGEGGEVGGAIAFAAAWLKAVASEPLAFAGPLALVLAILLCASFAGLLCFVFAGGGEAVGRIFGRTSGGGAVVCVFLGAGVVAGAGKHASSAELLACVVAFFDGV